MQPKAVAILAGGESMVENLREVFPRNSDSIVAHGNVYPPVGGANADCHPFVFRAGIVAGVSDVANHIDEDL